MRGGGVVEDPGELAGADHPGFVDDQHGARPEVAVFAIVERDEQAGDGVAGDAGGGFELGGGTGGEGSADDVMAGALPGVAGGVEAERLAGPGGGDQDIDRASRGGERDDQLDLLVREAGTRCERVEHVVLAGDAETSVRLVDWRVRRGGSRARRVPGWRSGCRSRVCRSAGLSSGVASCRPGHGRRARAGLHVGR